MPITNLFKGHRKRDDNHVQIHIVLPKLLWQVVKETAKFTGTSATKLVIRALNWEAYILKIRVDDPGARFYVEHADGSQEELPLEDLP
ncbi:MAG: hypothetical protein ABSA33_06235, partial [Candidatus Micrarchaeaceae archaeon]